MIQVKWRNLLIAAAIYAAGVLGGAYVIAGSAVDEVAQITYDNSIKNCLRSNDAREPINDFFVVFQRDEAKETDDPQVAKAAKKAEAGTRQTNCDSKITPPNGVDTYVP